MNSRFIMVLFAVIAMQLPVRAQFLAIHNEGKTDTLENRLDFSSDAAGNWSIGSSYDANRDLSKIKLLQLVPKKTKQLKGIFCSKETLIYITYDNEGKPLRAIEKYPYLFDASDKGSYLLLSNGNWNHDWQIISSYQPSGIPHIEDASGYIVDGDTTWSASSSDITGVKFYAYIVANERIPLLYFRYLDIAGGSHSMGYDRNCGKYNYDSLNQLRDVLAEGVSIDKINYDNGNWNFLNGQYNKKSYDTYYIDFDISLEYSQEDN